MTLASGVDAVMKPAASGIRSMFVRDVLEAGDSLVGQKIAVRGAIYEHPGFRGVTDYDNVIRFRGNTPDQLSDVTKTIRFSNALPDSVTSELYAHPWGSAHPTHRGGNIAEVTGTVQAGEGNSLVMSADEVRFPARSWEDWYFHHDTPIMREFYGKPEPSFV